MIKLSNAAHSAKSLKLFTSYLTMALAVTLVGCNSSDNAEGEESSSESALGLEPKDEEPELTEEEIQAMEDEEAEAEGGIAIGDNEYEEVTFVESIDGNNVVVETESGQETIRLAGVDAPTEGDHLWVRTAKDWAEPDHAVGETVQLVRAEPSQNENGESLGYIWYRNGEETYNINYELVNGGMARVPSDFEDERYKDRLLAGQEQVKNQEFYIWSLDGFATESGYDYELLDEEIKRQEEEASSN